MMGVFGVSGPSIAHANLDEGGGDYCPPEFDRCDGTGWHDCYDYGPCGGGGGGGEGGAAVAAVGNPP